MGGAHTATAVGFVSAFSRLPVHPVNTKANNRAMILIRAIPFCQVSKQGIRREGNAIIGIGGWKYDPRENRERARSRLTFGCIRTRRDSERVGHPSAILILPAAVKRMPP